MGDLLKVYIYIKISNVTDVSTQFWFSSSDNQAYDFIKDFSDYADQFGDSIKFTPHYVIWYCAGCRNSGYTKPEPNCLSAGRFCAPDPGNLLL